MTIHDSGPVKRLVNTHWHADHTDGNDWLHRAGASILAHENTQRHLSKATRVEGWDFTFRPSPSGAIPAATMNREKVLRFNSSSIHLEYYGPAHTDGDIFAHFLEADIFHTGDTWWNGYYPFIDYSTGGSIDGSIRAVETNLAKTTEEMIIIPGHGPIGRKSDLRIYLDLLVAARDRISILKRQGRSLPEVIAAKPTAGYDEKWGGGLINRANFTGLVYEGV